MYCAYWAKLLNFAMQDLGEIVVDEDKDVKALSIEFSNGARINALSSNPSQFRSKGGKIVLDEFAHHKDAQALWTAASASAIVWGYPIRILSTDNGQSCKFYKFVNDILRGRLKWSLHKTDIFDAVNQGLPYYHRGQYSCYTSIFGIYNALSADIFPDRLPVL